MVSELVFETRQVQLRRYAEEDDGASWFICEKASKWNVAVVRFVDGPPGLR